MDDVREYDKLRLPKLCRCDMREISHAFGAVRYESAVLMLPL